MDTEMKGRKFPQAVQLIIADKNCVYGLNRKSGKYGFVGGMVEIGESIFEALQREVKEEIGFNISFDDVILLKTLFYDNKQQYAYLLSPNGYNNFLSNKIIVEKDRSFEIFDRKNYLSKSQYCDYDSEILDQVDTFIYFWEENNKEWYLIIISKSIWGFESSPIQQVQDLFVDNYKKDGTAQHYEDHLIISIEKMELIYGTVGTIIFCECTILKYKDRLGKKEGTDISSDIMKINWYERKSKELQAKLGLSSEIKSYHFDNKIAELKLINFTSYGTDSNEQK